METVGDHGHDIGRTVHCDALPGGGGGAHRDADGTVISLC